MRLVRARSGDALRFLFGGGDGMRPRFEKENGAALNPKGIHVIDPGDALIVRAHGGGGYGHPASRHPGVVAGDIRNGYVSERQEG